MNPICCLEAVFTYPTPLCCKQDERTANVLLKPFCLQAAEFFWRNRAQRMQQLMSFKDPTVSAAESETCVVRLWLAAPTGLFAWGLWFIFSGRVFLKQWPWPINNRNSTILTDFGESSLFKCSQFSFSFTHQPCSHSAINVSLVLAHIHSITDWCACRAKKNGI